MVHPAQPSPQQLLLTLPSSIKTHHEQGPAWRHRDARSLFPIQSQSKVFNNNWDGGEHPPALVLEGVVGVQEGLPFCPRRPLAGQVLHVFGPASDVDWFFWGYWGDKTTKQEVLELFCSSHGDTNPKSKLRSQLSLCIPRNA